jgi:histone H3/H4
MELEVEAAKRQVLERAGAEYPQAPAARWIRAAMAEVEAEVAAAAATADEEAAIFWREVREVRALEGLEAAKRRVLEEAGAAYPKAPAARWVREAMAEVAAEAAAEAAPAKRRRGEGGVRRLTSHERKRLKRNQPR